MTRYKDTGSNAPTDTRPSDHKGLKPPAITPQPKRGKQNDKENDQKTRTRSPRSNKC